MRTLTSVLLLLLAASPAFGEAIAGKTRILLIDRCNEYWVPLAGGTAEPINWSPAARINLSICSDAISAAYDGERFLINYGGSHAAFFEEGASEPTTIVLLDERATFSSSRVRWDGTRYIAAWSGNAGRFTSLRGAAITRDGAIVDRFELSKRERIAGLAVNDGHVLVLDAPGQPLLIDAPLQIDMQVSGTILDEKLTPRHSFIVGHAYENVQIFVDGGMVVDVLDAAPFGDGFYVAWIEEQISFGQLSPDATVRGTRITMDGAMLDITPAMNGRAIAQNAPSRDVDLVAAGEYLLAVVKREDRGPVNGIFIDKNGLIVATRLLLPERDPDSGLPPIIETVRLPDGRLALVSKPQFGSTVTVTPIVATPPQPRRRAVR